MNRSPARLALAVWLAGTVCVAALPQSAQTPRGDASIAGRLVDIGTGSPIANALVDLIPLIGAQAANGETYLIHADAFLAGRARVSPPQQMRTVRDGVFEFRGLTAGSYLISATPPSYERVRSGQTAPDQEYTPITLTANQQRNDVMLRAWKPGALEGRVLDESGEPVGDVDVLALRQTFVAGEARLTTGPVARTGDDGRYRLTGVTAGTYLVAVPATSISLPESVFETLSANDARAEGAAVRMRRSGGSAGSAAAVTVAGSRLDWRGPAGFQPDLTRDNWWVYAPTFYVSTPDAPSATPLTVMSSTELRGLDVHLRPSRGQTVSGRIVGDSDTAAHFALHLIRTGQDMLTSSRELETAVATTDEAGSFTFVAVPPGHYIVRALAADRAWPPPLRSAEGLAELSVLASGQLSLPRRESSDPLLWSTSSVAVGELDVRGLEVRLRSGLRARGTLRFADDATSERPREVTRTSIGFSPIVPAIGPSAAAVRVDSSLQFESAALAPGRYQVSITAPYGTWRLSQVTVAGRDVYDTIDLTNDLDDLVVTLTDRETQAAGIIVGDRAVLATTKVIAFPADVEGWVASGMNRTYLRPAAVDASGAFTLRWLRPGNFRVVLVSTNERLALDDPAFIRSLVARSTLVTLKAGLNQLMPIRVNSRHARPAR